MLLNTKRKKKRMKRHGSGCGRNEESAVLSREVNVLAETDANFPIMSRELQIPVGVLRIEVRDGDMRSLKVLAGVRMIQVPEQQAVEGWP